MRKRFFKMVAVVLLLPLLLLALFLLVERWRGQISLASYQRGLVAQGEKLTARDFARPAPAGDNGAPTVLAAQKELAAGTVLPNHYPPRMKLTPFGRAVVGFREAEWVDDKTTYHWEDLAADLKANEPTLARIRAALGQPVLANQIDYSLGAKMSFLHLMGAKSLTYWLGAGVQLALHEGRPGAALADLTCEIQLPRLLADDRLVISELVRVALAAIARTDTWEALQADGWEDADLARIQQAWESQAFATGMAHGLEGELVFGHTTFQQARESNQVAVNTIYGMQQFLGDDSSQRPAWEQVVRELPGGDGLAEFLKKQVYCRIWRFAWLDQAELRSLTGTHRLLVLCRQAAANKSLAQVEPAIQRVIAGSTNRGLYDALRYPVDDAPSSLSRTLNRAMHAETERSLILCAIGLKRYALRHGALPPTLSGLVPEFLASVPYDYLDGQVIRYRSNADGTFTLYSIGDNGKDDGGDASPLPEKTGGGNLWHRKDAVWPAPALPEEVEAYRSEAKR